MNENIYSWLKRDGWVVIICLAAVLACLLVYNNSLGVLEKCNTYWQEHWQDKCAGKSAIPDVYNFSIENNYKSIGGLNQNEEYKILD